jgi:multisubunit Na+/H+ antiporter MnhG subunit
MMKNINLRNYLVHVLIPLLGGTVIYLLGRSLALLQMNTVLKLPYASPHLKLPEWLIYNVPDGLWLYSFLMWLIITWKGVTGIQPCIWFVLLVLGAIGSEFLQKRSAIHGTYDINDLNAYFVSILFCLKNYYQLNHTNMKRTLISSIILVLAFFTYIASTSNAVPIETTKVFTFDYTPKSTAKAGSANFLIALTTPKFKHAENNFLGGYTLYTKLQESFQADIDEMLISKGFNLKGTYSSYDEMVFMDKKEVQLLISLEIVPNITVVSGGWVRGVSANKQEIWAYRGVVTLGGKINIWGVEPMSNEKVYVKSIVIPTVENIALDSKGYYLNALDAAKRLYNPMGDAYLQIYANIIEKINVQLDPQEMLTLKKEIKELKAKKGY